MRYSMGMRRRSRAIIAISASLSCLTALSSCDWISSLFPESFGPEYDDTTTNYIAAHSLSAPPLASDQGSTIGLDSPAIWDWAWRGVSGNSFQYMTLADEGTVGTAVASGGYTLDADESVWRLELVNLAGDPYLEGQSIGSTPSGWIIEDLADPTTTPQAVVIAANALSHGRSIQLVATGNDWAGFDPNVTGFILDDPTLLRTTEYVLRAFSTKATITYLIDDASGSESFDGAPSSSLYNARHRFSEFRVVSADTRFMTAGASGSQDINLDDLRFTRSDLGEGARLRLILRPSDTIPTLVAGKYEFSVWARWPDDALPYDSTSRTQNGFYEARFAARKLTLRIIQTGFLVDRDTPVKFQESFDVGSDWTRLALRMDGGNLDRFDESSSEAVIELAIFPYDDQDMDCGSALIAAPSLRFFKDGYPD